MSYIHRAMSSLLKAAKDTLRVARDLYMIMIPVMILVKILQDADLIQYVALPLEPIMSLVGLPPEMGIAWAAALLNNMYSGLIIFLQLAQYNPDALTTANVTILGGMMLIAHGIPVECGVARRCGARFLTQAAIRIGTAIVFGLIMHALSASFGYLDHPATIPLPFDSSTTAASWLDWAMIEGEKLLWIALIIFALIVCMDILRFLGVLNLINTIMSPLMRLIGVSRKAASINVVGLTLGLSYGSGIIIQEAKKGELTTEDVFFSLSFMGICHSLIEDVLLVALVGGDIFSLLVIRTLICLGIMTILVQTVRHMPNKLKQRLLWVPPKASPAET